MTDTTPAEFSVERLSPLAITIGQRLREAFGLSVWRNPYPPLDELVSTILSQNTNDLNRDRAFKTLRQRYPTWEAVRDAPLDAVIAAIRTAGLANQKGARIQIILREITAEHGSLDLSFLEKMPPKEVHAWLTHFNGVGEKTAAIVMLFSLGMPAFPVDTHIYRISGRLGLRPEKMTVDQAHAHLASIFPADHYEVDHLNLIHLGREICQARQPQCDRCPLKVLCRYAQGRPPKGDIDSNSLGGYTFENSL